MSAQPGFFGRIKNNFTQYAAGTDDLSQLSETQQKLLRREAIGRLGASLYRNGDFGEAMQQQGEINAKRLEQRQAEEQARRISEAWTPEQSIIASPGGVGAPQVPTLLNPASTNAAPGQPRQLPAQQPAAAGGVAAPGGGGGGGGMTAGTGGDLISARAYYEGVGRRLAAMGQEEQAKLALDMAKHYAPNEKISYQEVLGADGRPRLLQTGEYGTMRETDYRPREVAAIEEAQRYLDNPELLDPALRLRAAGATRMHTNLMPGETEQQKLDAQFLYGAGGLREQALAAQQTLSSLGGLESVLNTADTGATEEYLARIGTFFGTTAGADLQSTKQALAPIILANIKQLGVNPSNADLTFLERGMPGFGSDPRANAIGLRLLRQAAEARLNTFRSAETYYHDNNRALTGYAGYVPPAGGGAAGGAAAGNIPPFGTPEFDEWLRRNSGGTP